MEHDRDTGPNSGYGIQNGYVYYAYMPLDWRELADAVGAGRLTIRDGLVAGSHYLDGAEWVWDAEVARDASGIGGVSHMRPITPDELRWLIKTKSPSVDSDKVLSA